MARHFTWQELHPGENKKCQYCGKEFVLKQNGARVKHCSDECYKNDLKKRHREGARRNKKSNYEMRECVYCGELFTPPWRFPQQKYCSLSCRRRHDEITRSSRYENADKDKGITLRKVAELDGNICYLCGKPVDWSDCDKKKNAYYKMYPSIEHIIPLSKGGSDTWDNVRLAHMSCNSKKGIKIS